MKPDIPNGFQLIEVGDQLLAGDLVYCPDIKIWDNENKKWISPESPWVSADEIVDKIKGRIVSDKNKILPYGFYIRKTI